jgi:2-keto-4-pentenoate hydratase/2-oxohepta-3-ene-1,7-dioic acid hydratase in catechol pathway
MKLIRFGQPGRECPGLQLEDGIRIDASSFGEDFDERFFESGGLERLRSWASAQGPQAPRLAPGERLGPPIGRPSKIVCVGLNYRDHAAESGMGLPNEPVIFLKSTTSIVGPDDALVIPRNAKKVDWEVELAAVIGQKATYVTTEHALDYVAGYLLHNDYSEREFQLERGGQWVKGKSADTFAPLGPFLATPDEFVGLDSGSAPDLDPDAAASWIPAPGSIARGHRRVGRLNMWLRVNGQTRQNSSTANMIFDVPTLVSYISQFMTLQPGDIISTGTPSGVALGMRPAPVYLKAGDVVTLGIEGLGEARQTVVEPV